MGKLSTADRKVAEVVFGGEVVRRAIHPAYSVMMKELGVWETMQRISTTLGKGSPR